MITRIEIDGFKSFRQFQLDLEPFQVIVGLNAAGKSNLLDAFRFLAKVVTSDVKTAYQEMWATAGELFTLLPDGTATDRISFALEFLSEFAGRKDKKNRYARVRYELCIRRADGALGSELTVEDERLVGIKAEHDAWAAFRSLKEWQEFFSQVVKPPALIPLTVYVSSRTSPASTKTRELVAPKGATVLGRYNFASPILEAVFSELEQTTFLDIEPEAIRTPVSAQGPSRLKENGTYLPNVLARMQKQDEFLLGDVSADLSNLVSGLIRVAVEEDTALGHHLVWVFTSEGKRFSLRELSDGTLRLLALTALRNDPDQNGTLLIEEPENGVHPFRVKLLATLLRSMASDFSRPPEQGERLCQVIATTHSPALVAQLDDHEIVFAHTADVTVEGYTKPSRITRMASLKAAASAAQAAFTRREILQYLDESDLETRSKRLRGEKS
jgi:predicted ATPase